MKKSILVVLGIIPLLFSCNNNSKGFVDPFPNDEYDSKKIGFKVTSDETIERSLTTQESDLLANTVENLSYINSTLLHRDEGSIHERDYTRAFAGVFKEGYDTYNMMYDEEFKSFYQPKSEVTKQRILEINNNAKINMPLNKNFLLFSYNLPIFSASSEGSFLTLT